ncbi:MAG TPA: glycosyltransferase family A protein [Candidatus Saccharimonadales bacterium]|nr:glycosyltransferase family A protein [Candidatus Saccharimonadales bacterium]
MTQKALTLSLIIPAYNEENHLKACLEAIANQIVLPDEVIVVDNNSTDKTAQIARQFPFVKFLKEHQQGLYFARQRGLNAATSEILGRIDADTIIDENWTQAVISAFQNPTISAVSGPVGYHDMPFPQFTRGVEDIFLRLAKAGHYHFLMGANMAIRSSTWQLIKNDLCNKPFIFEDIDLAIHLTSHHFLPTYVTQMMAHVSSRRLQDRPNDFLRYIGGHSRTLEYHYLTTPPGVHLSETALAATYFLIKPLHMAFDPKLRRPSLAYLLESRQARPDPMMVS